MLPAKVLVTLLCLSVGGAQETNIEKLVKHVPGVPGEDYPIFPLPPDTSFLCEVQPVEGYYADPEADCQLYHVCSDSGDGKYVKFDFLCPNGTVFNQAEFVCDWWFNVDCSTSESLYFLNIEVAEKNAERQRQRELEREQNKEEERTRQELSADEINDLRTGGAGQRKEQPRRPNSVGGRPPVQASQFSQIKSRPKSFSGRSKSKTTPAPRSANRFTGFGRSRQSKSKPLTTSSGRVKTTINLKNSNSQTNPFRSNFAFGRQSVKSASRNEGTKKKKKNSRLRKAKNQNNTGQSLSRHKTKSFTSFGNGQSRFGNF